MSIVQLTAQGVQQEPFIDNSENTFLDYKYKKHSNFATEFITNDFNENGQLTVSIYGDLVDFHLIVESNYKLTNLLLLRLLKKITLTIGGSILMNVDPFSYFTFLLIKNENINENKCYNENSKIIYKYSLKLPFNINSQLPIISLQNHPVILNCSLNKFNKEEVREIMHTDENEKDIDMLPIWKNLPSEIVSNILEKLELFYDYYGSVSLAKTKLGCDYVFLDTKERNNFVDSFHDLLLDKIYTI